MLFNLSRSQSHYLCKVNAEQPRNMELTWVLQGLNEMIHVQVYLTLRKHVQLFFPYNANIQKVSGPYKSS